MRNSVASTYVFSCDGIRGGPIGVIPCHGDCAFPIQATWDQFTAPKVKRWESRGRCGRELLFKIITVEVCFPGASSSSSLGR